MGTESNLAAGVREKRRFPRLAGRYPLRFKVINERTSIEPYRTGTTLDLSRGGLRFVTEARLSVSDNLAVHLTIPGGARTVSGLAEVLRVKLAEEAEPRGGARPIVEVFEVAVCFLWSGWHDGEMQQIIAHYVRGELESGEGREVRWQ